MSDGLGVLALSFIATFLAIKVLVPLARWAKLVDKPGGRKKHDGLIPLIGGLAIYAGVAGSVLLFVEQPIFIRLFLLAGGLIVFMGMLDDRYDLSARFRLVGQLLVCCIFVYGFGLHIESFGDLFGIGELKAGWLGYPLAVLSLMGAINAFNMLDGMDGLVGSITIVSFVALVGLFGDAGFANMQMLCTAFVGAIGAFLIFNVWGKPEGKKIEKIFMGDAGSMFLGLSVGVIAIYGSQKPVAAFSPVTALWLVLLPMVDMFTIMYRRLKRGKSPMAPDRTHLHHILLRAGYQKKMTLNIMLAVQTLFVCLGVLIVASGIPEGISFVAAIGFVGAYQLLMKRSWKFIRWSKRRLVNV